jgi:hypothetical protein
VRVDGVDPFRWEESPCPFLVAIPEQPANPCHLWSKILDTNDPFFDKLTHQMPTDTDLDAVVIEPGAAQRPLRVPLDVNVGVVKTPLPFRRR